MQRLCSCPQNQAATSPAAWIFCQLSWSLGLIAPLPIALNAEKSWWCEKRIVRPPVSEKRRTLSTCHVSSCGIQIGDVVVHVERIVIVQPGVHAEELPARGAQREVAGLLRPARVERRRRIELRQQAVEARAAGVDVVVAAEVVDRHAAGAAVENLVDDVEEVLLAFGRRAGVVDVAEMDQHVGIVLRHLLEESRRRPRSRSPNRPPRRCGRWRGADRSRSRPGSDSERRGSRLSCP